MPIPDTYAAVTQKGVFTAIRKFIVVAIILAFVVAGIIVFGAKCQQDDPDDNIPPYVWPGKGDNRIWDNWPGGMENTAIYEYVIQLNICSPDCTPLRDITLKFPKFSPATVENVVCTVFLNTTWPPTFIIEDGEPKRLQPILVKDRTAFPLMDFKENEDDENNYVFTIDSICYPEIVVFVLRFRGPKWEPFGSDTGRPNPFADPRYYPAYLPPVDQDNTAYIDCPSQILIQDFYARLYYENVEIYEDMLIPRNLVITPPFEIPLFKCGWTYHMT